MQDPRDTDDRLKNRLNGDQPSRERMCMAILALERRYSQIEPRRPEGGPDGARDIQAHFDKVIVAWGAVGFQNSATDSAENKRLAKGKFTKDLNDALAAKSDLKAFAFFTNVDLTPGEIDELRDSANSKGITHLDIFWRERLRHALDSPAGLGIRFQYLKLALSEAEQASFFNNYGRQLEELVMKQGKGVEEGFQRLEFLHWMSRPLREVALTIHLKKRYKAAEIGRFRVLGKLFNTPESLEEGWFIGGQDNYYRMDDSSLRFRTETVFSFFKDVPKLEVVKSAGAIVLQPWLDRLSFGICFGFGGTAIPEIFEGKHLRIFLTEHLKDAIKAMTFALNGYEVISRSKFEFSKHGLNIEWPEARPDDADSGEWYGESFINTIDFTWTPPKVNY